MRTATLGILISIALYLAAGLVVLAVHGPVQMGEFGFWKEAAR